VKQTRGGLDTWREGEERAMPEISRFYGIIVRMFIDDHEPPHFHVRYGEFEAEVEIDRIKVTSGWLPRRVSALVTEWALAHRLELQEDWMLARMHCALRPIEPLE
jgi:hypothetical protein